MNEARAREILANETLPTYEAAEARSFLAGLEAGRKENDKWRKEAKRLAKAAYGLEAAVMKDAMERNSISGFTGARLTDVWQALAAFEKMKPDQGER